ncbi:MAG: hypothetical protein AAFZ18_30150 [Myxococcota bacterium]
MNRDTDCPPPDERAGERLLNRLGSIERDPSADLPVLPSDEMSPAEEAALAERLTLRAGASGEPEPQKRPAVAEPRRGRWKGRAWGVGSGLALAASFAFSWLAREEPTKYRLETTGSDLRHRGELRDTRALPVHHTGSRLAFVLRPSSRPRRIGVPRMAELRPRGPARELEGEWVSAPSGAFRFESRVAELLPERLGDVTLAFTVAASRDAPVRWLNSQEADQADVMIYRFKILEE